MTQTISSIVVHRCIQQVHHYVDTIRCNTAVWKNDLYFVVCIPHYSKATKDAQNIENVQLSCVYVLFSTKDSLILPTKHNFVRVLLNAYNV